MWGLIRPSLLPGARICMEKGVKMLLLAVASLKGCDGRMRAAHAPHTPLQPRQRHRIGGWAEGWTVCGGAAAAALSGQHCRAVCCRLSASGRLEVTAVCLRHKAAAGCTRPVHRITCMQFPTG